MAKRLISLRTISGEKIDRKRTWIKNMIAAGLFPEPEIRGAGSGSDLWDEEKVDRFVQDYIATGKEQASIAKRRNAKRVEKASTMRAASQKLVAA